MAFGRPSGRRHREPGDRAGRRDAADPVRPLRGEPERAVGAARDVGRPAPGFQPVLGQERAGRRHARDHAARELRGPEIAVGTRGDRIAGDREARDDARCRRARGAGREQQREGEQRERRCTGQCTTWPLGLRARSQRRHPDGHAST